MPSRGETRTIPVVFANVADPVASGIVERLNQPGGKITGFAVYEPTLGGKWLELLSEIAPGLKRAVIMFNPAPASSFMPLLDPSGNVTGFGGLEPSLGGKWLELLSEIAPGLSGPQSCSIPT